MLRDNPAGSSSRCSAAREVLLPRCTLAGESHRTIDPHALKIPARRAEYSLTENAASPFHAEPRHNDIIMILADIAQDPAQLGSTRVSAVLGLADIFLLRARNIKELENFYGWTTEELKTYSETGETPPRLRRFLEAGDGAAINGSASLRTDKNVRS